MMLTKKPICLQAPWQVPSNIHTLITTSKNDFNPALHVGAERENVLNNRTKLAKLLPTPPLWLNQTHSTKVINWDDATYTENIDADASCTTRSNQPCVVMTADCLPILLTNQSGEFVAAIHAGWRGLFDGIIENTLAELQKFEPSTMLAFIGPAINQECFEVGAEVYEQFITKYPHTQSYFMHSPNQNKYLADLRGIAENYLIQAGLKPQNISNPNICTKCTPNWFYSYRANPQTGRIATLIWKD